MSIRLVLLDSDRPYIEKFAAWLHKHMPCQFSIEILTHSKSFQAWTESGGQADVVVIAIDMAQEVFPYLTGNYVLILDDGTHGSMSLDMPRLDKYRPAEELAKDILSLCADRMPRMHVRGKHSQSITLIINLDGADAMNPVAPAVARFFSTRNRKTLYLSLEQAQATRLFFNGTGSRGLNEMLYYLKSNKDNLYMRLETCLTKDMASGVHFLSAPSGLLRPDIIAMSDIENLLSAINMEGDFEEIVLVTEPGMFDLISGLMEKASRVLAVAPNTAVSSVRLEKFLQELEKGGADMAGLKAKLRLLLVEVCRSDGFDGQFDDIRKYRLAAHPAESGTSYWVPHDSDLSLLASILDDEDKGIST